MKKILLLALMITSLNYAQDKAVDSVKRILEQKNTISVGLIAAEPFTINLTYERKKNDQSLFFKTNQSRIISIGNGGLSVTNGFKTVDGYGLVVSLGTKVSNPTTSTVLKVADFGLPITGPVNLSTSSIVNPISLTK